jgi:hypothetical protein
VGCVALALSAVGCAPDLRDRLTRDDGDGDVETVQEGVLDTGADLSIPQEVVVDSTSETEWYLYDFERQGLVDEDKPWDIRLQRYRIQLNGGVNGDGGVVGVVLEDVDFDDVTEADVPPEGDAAWRTDEADADGDGEDETLFIDWFDYDSSTHILSPKRRTTLLRSVEGTVVKFEVVDYYDDAGTSGFLSFRWAQLPLG